ncbi:hypothetical protein E4U19_006378, partial [Claviceps sp. Clav32 group G5]
EMQAPGTLPGWEDARLESSELVFGDCFEESSEDEDNLDAENVVRQESQTYWYQSIFVFNPENIELGHHTNTTRPYLYSHEAHIVVDSYYHKGQTVKLISPELREHKCGHHELSCALMALDKSLTTYNWS